MGIKSVVLMKPIVIIALPAYVSVHNSIKLYIWQELFIPPDTYTRYEINFCCIIYITSFK